MRCGLSFLIGTAALAGAPPVLAQSTSDVAAVAPSAIIVTANRATTATKTDTPIIDIPQSIGVVTSDQIAARGAIGLQEALRYSAGVRTEPNGADFRFDYILARGGFSAARYIDGMRTADSSFTPRTEIFNQERIEVLRGPSSVLYGQATAGGLVNSVTKRPEFEAHGEFAVQYGSFDRKQAQADVTGPINAAGTLAARLVVVARDAGTQTDFGKDNRIMVAPSISFRPDDRTEITLMSLYQRDRAASVYTFYPVSATLLAPEGERLRWGAYLGEPSLNFYNSRPSRIIANDITITASYSYLHARTGAGPDSLGEKLRISAVPTHQASLSGEKKIVLRDDLALRLGGGVRYIGPSVEANVFYDLDPAGSIVSLKTPGFTLVDALAALEWQRWSLSLNAMNLLDKHYYGSCSPRTACGPGYGRNVVGTLGYRF